MLYVDATHPPHVGRTDGDKRDKCFWFSAEFSIWTREAGAGGLSIAVEGPSKAEITFEDRKDGSCGVAYVVQEPGEPLIQTLDQI